MQVVTSNLATPTSTTATPLAKKSSSVPSGLDSPQHQQQGSASKKRKLFTQSLGQDNMQYCLLHPCIISPDIFIPLLFQTRR